MIIENVDALRDWLTKCLEPLCDADPIALAKYVMALIKKDRPEKELKTVCMDQLEVFLQQKTITFVDTLFETIADKSYLKTANNATATTPSTPSATSSSKTSTQTSEPTSSSVTVSDTPSSARKSPEVAVTASKTTEQPANNTSQSNSETTHETSYKARETKRNRSRSRSRSPVRVRRDFDSRRLGPNSRNGERNYYNDDRRNRRGLSNIQRRSGPQRYGGGHRNERDYRRNDRNLKRGRSRSRSRSYSSGSSRSRSRSRSRSWSKDRDRDSPSNKKSRPSSRPTSRSPSPAKTAPKDGEKSKKCRDYEEKGFCLKGHLCPYDHGNDPVVLDSNVSAALFTNNSGGNAPIMPIPSGTIAPNPPSSYLAEPYNPEAPGMDPQRPHPPQGHPMGPRMPPPGYWGPMPLRGPLPGPPLPPPQFMPPPGRPRELIGVPTIDNNMRHSQPLSNRTVIDPNIPMRGGMRGGHKHMGRGGYRNMRRVISESADKTCLEVRKIPPNMNTISHLNEHFSKFGNIVNLQVKHEGDPEAALVQYATHSEALAAIRSTEAVLNNRFIKVFWHSKELQQKHEQAFGVKSEEQTEESETNGTKVSIKDRLGPKVSETESVLTAVNSSGTISRTVFDPSKLKKNNTINNQTKDTNSDTNNTKTIPDSTNADKNSSKSDELNRKHIYSKRLEMLENLIEEQKTLMTKLEKSTNDNERKKVKETMDVISKQISSITESIKNVARKDSSPAKKPTTKEEIMLAILNTDLDLFMKMQKKDVSYIEAAKEYHRMERLKRQKLMASRGRGGRGFPRRGRGLSRRGSFYGRGSNPLLKVDRRTRKLLIPEINEDDITDLLEHLASFSDVEVIEPSSNGAVVTFKTREDAEKATKNMSQTKFKEKFQLSYSWFDEKAKPQNKGEANQSVDPSKSDNEANDVKTDAFGAIEDQDVLDFEEEDTEDESEARNWKA